MKPVVLTTETLHHAYFVRELAKIYPLTSAVLETEPLKPPFPCRHPFEEEREEFERGDFFGSGPCATRDFAPCLAFPDVNRPEAVAALRRLEPDVVLVVGTGRLRAPLLEAFPGRILNFHGGDPEEYRGLDSHLWSIYHRDFASLVVTFHFVDAGLDTGNIILQGDVPLARGMRLRELRGANIRLCVDMCLAALAGLERVGKLASRRQRKRGRYYSLMPAELKGICLRRFEDHTASLPGAA